MTDWRLTSAVEVVDSLPEQRVRLVRVSRFTQLESRRSALTSIGKAQCGRVYSWVSQRERKPVARNLGINTGERHV
jgi:hypothetical protein